MTSKYIELARKIYELVKKGYEGEKEAARVQLEKLMKKHSISISDIEGVEVKRHFFRVTKSEMKLFNQVKYHVMGKVRSATYWSNSRSKPEVFIECTAEQAIEIEVKFSIYKVDLQKVYKAAYTAFVHKNNIFPDDDDSEGSDDSQKLSDTDRMAMMMMDGINRSNVHRQLT